MPERPVADLYKKYCKRLGTVMKSSHKAKKTVISAWIDNDINSTETEKKDLLENAVSF